MAANAEKGEAIMNTDLLSNTARFQNDTFLTILATK